ncbi:MAG: LON peptidase substrate-binding domain-containing protein [Acidobacteria bacterium]|nr:LON peptidase substrate-binding domain-containing protein [Acidobacteriota bacterium]
MGGKIHLQMVTHALSADRRIGMVLLKPGWEPVYYERPPIHAVGGMGEITEYRQLENEEFDIILRGLSRYRIIEELPGGSYRVARVQLLPDIGPGSKFVGQFAGELVSCFREVVKESVANELNLDVLTRLDFVALVNAVCSSLDLDVREKQSLLELDQVKVRAERILVLLRQRLFQKRCLQKFNHLRPQDPRVN